MLMPSAEAQEAAQGTQQENAGLLEERVSADRNAAAPLLADTIVVTARKIAEPIREVPFGISVFQFQREDVQRLDLDDQRAFGRLVPGFNLVDNGLRGSAIPNIRGVGSFFGFAPDDGAVPVYVDGIPVPQRSQDREFFDITGIDILRGPQNVLYGGNAMGGAISITTADPVFEPVFEIGGEVGNFDSYRATGLVNLPLSSTVAVRIAAQYDTRDGDIPDLNLNQNVRDSDIFNIHSKLLWRPDDLTDVTLAFRYADYDEEPTFGVYAENPDFPQAFLDRETQYDLETIEAGLTIRRDLGGFELSSLTGYQHYSLDFAADDSDGLALEALTGFPRQAFNDPNADFREFQDDAIRVSQEVRLTGELDNGTKLIGGVSYLHSELDFSILFNATGFINAQTDNRFTTDSYGVFGEATVPVTQRLRLIGGVRYTFEDRGFEGETEDLSGSAPVSQLSENTEIDFSLLTGRFALSFDLNSTLSSFASISRGAKPGGFELQDTDVLFGGATGSFSEATSWAYETGIRGTLFDERVYLSTSIYFNEVKDENLFVFTAFPPLSTTVDVDYKAYGLELEANIAVTDRLSLSGGLALLETEIVQSDDATVPAKAELPFSPPVAFNVAATYEQPLTLFAVNGEAFGRIDYQFVGERAADPQNSLDIESFDIVNIRAGWDTERFSIYAFAENLFDDTFIEAATSFGAAPDGSPVSLGVPGQPRRYGVGARVRF